MPYYHLVLSAVGDGVSANPLINSFTYDTSELVPTSVGAEVLANEFVDKFLTGDQRLTAIVTSGTIFDSIVVKAPQVPTVLYVVSGLGEPGLRTGETMPRFVAWQFKSPRSVGNIREGKKRFGLVGESDVLNGVAVAAFVDTLEACANSLSETLTGTVSGIATNFRPIIVKRIAYTPPGGGTAYRLPEGLDTLTFALADNWVYQDVTSQNSRKR